jgi:DNA-binding NarL/FixJ family response regulator
LAQQNIAAENFEKRLLFARKERQILKLNLDGFKNEEISHQLNISEKTVSNSLSISRKSKRIFGCFGIR